MRKYIVLLFLTSFFIEVNAQDVISKIGFTQGTTYSIRYVDSQQRDFSKQIDSILIHFSKIFSTYDSTSTVSMVNANRSVKLDSMFIACFNASIKISKETDGAFDITVSPLVTAWGFGQNIKRNLTQTQIDSLLQIVGYKKVSIINNSVVKKDSRTTLNFNAIAQGYSVDIISEFLMRQNIQNFVVEIGGEVYARGKKPNGENWFVGIEKPTDNRTDAMNELQYVIKVQNKAVSTSGSYRKFYVENGVKYSHTINPQTGYPSKNNVVSVTIISNDCATADGYATACMVMGLAKSQKFLQSHSELDACIMYYDESGKLQIFSTKGFDEFVK